MAHSSSSPDKESFGPGIRRQLDFVVNLYQCLTTLYFVLIEHNASTSATLTRGSLVGQIDKLLKLIDGGKAIQENLQPEQATSVERTDILQRLIGTTKSSKVSVSTSTSNPTQTTNIRLAITTLPRVLDAIEDLNKILNALLEKAFYHSANQYKINALIEQIGMRDNETITTIKGLAKLHEQLRRTQKYAEREVNQMQRSEDRPLPYKDVLQYAQTLSQTTTAPSAFVKQRMALHRQKYEDQLQDAEKTEQQQGMDGVNGHLPPLPSLTLDQIPADLQDKLPFPSIDAIRRSAMQVEIPSWQTFLSQQAAASGNVVAEENAQHASPAQQPQPQQPPEPPLTTRSSARRQSKQQQQQREVRPPPTRDDDDGFGLDLS